MLVRINLLCHSYSGDSAYLISTDENKLRPLSIDINNLDIDKDVSTTTILKKKFLEHIDMDYSWANPELLEVDIFTTDENILQTQIYFSCYVPYKTSKKNCYWFLIDDIIPHSKILRKALLL